MMMTSKGAQTRKEESKILHGQRYAHRVRVACEGVQLMLLFIGRQVQKLDVGYGYTPDNNVTFPMRGKGAAGT